MLLRKWGDLRIVFMGYGRYAMLHFESETTMQNYDYLN